MLRVRDRYFFFMISPRGARDGVREKQVLQPAKPRAEE